jgi:hypothetical protein
MATPDRYLARARVLLAMASRETDPIVRGKLAELATVFQQLADRIPDAAVEFEVSSASSVKSIDQGKKDVR